MNASPSKRFPSSQKRSLVERAAALKASVARMVRPRLAHQPSSETLPAGPAVEGDGGDFLALDRGAHDLSRGYPSPSNRNPAAMGERPRQETDMGRHETFESADLILAGYDTRGDAREPLSDLAFACLSQVKRLQRWDADPNLLTEEEGDVEMDRWGGVFRRAIKEPSLNSSDLAGKAILMLDDLDRFHPEDEYPTDDYKLMRCILREVIGQGGLPEVSHASSVGSRSEPPFEAVSPEPTHEAIGGDILALGRSFDAAHDVWLEAVAANDEPSERLSAFLDDAKARGGPTINDYETAWALPGVQPAYDLEDSTYLTVAELAQRILRLQPRTIAELAVLARAVAPLVWTDGKFTQDASLGDDEDLDKVAVRRLIEASLALDSIVASAASLDQLVGLPIPSPVKASQMRGAR